jgi:hypothetical protein
MREKECKVEEERALFNFWDDKEIIRRGQAHGELGFVESFHWLFSFHGLRHLW